MPLKKDYKGKGHSELNKFLESLRVKRNVENTMKIAKSIIKLFLIFINKEFSKITEEDFNNYIKHLTEKVSEKTDKKLSENTLGKTIQWLKQFLLFYNKDFAKNIKLIKVKNKRITNWLTLKEVEQLKNKCKDFKPRDRAIILLFLSSGCRVGELIKANISDIDFNTNTIQIQGVKEGGNKIICFDNETKEALLCYLKVRIPMKDGSDALFTTNCKKRICYHWVLRIVKECSINAEINKPITCHSFRHTFITNTTFKTGDILFVSKAVNHKDIKTTMNYIHSNPQMLISKYEEYFGTKPIEDKEVMKQLDLRFLKGEIPTEIYFQIQQRYSQQQTQRKEILGYG